MWLLRFHISISILCFITFLGFANVYKEQIKKNGWLSEKENKKVSKYLFFLVPIMNVLFVILLFLMIFMKKEEFEALSKFEKNESEDEE